MKKLTPELKAQLLTLAMDCLETVKSMRIESVLLSVELETLKGA